MAGNPLCFQKEGNLPGCPRSSRPDDSSGSGRVADTTVFRSGVIGTFPASCTIVTKFVLDIVRENDEIAFACTSPGLIEGSQIWKESLQMEVDMNKRTFVLGLALSLTTLVIALSYAIEVQANECDGNACGSVSMKWTGSCYQATNNDSQRSVKVEVKPVGGAASAMSRVLKPGETWTLQSYPTGACMKGYVQPFHATFQ